MVAVVLSRGGAPCFGHRQALIARDGFERGTNMTPSQKIGADHILENGKLRIAT